MAVIMANTAKEKIVWQIIPYDKAIRILTFPGGEFKEPNPSSKSLFKRMFGVLVIFDN